MRNPQPSPSRDTARVVSQERPDESFQAYPDAWNAGDMDALRSMFHPDVVHTPPRGWPEPGPFVGRDAVMNQYEQLRETFHTETLEVAGVTPVGERFVVGTVWRGTGLGPNAELRMWQVVSLRDGLLISIEQFWNRDEALAAAGHEE